MTTATTTQGVTGTVSARALNQPVQQKYRGRNREIVDGYEVRWCDGNCEILPYESLLLFLVLVWRRGHMKATQCRGARV